MWEGRASPSSSSGLVLLGRLPTSRRTSLPTRLSQTTDSWTLKWTLGQIWETEKENMLYIVTVRHKKEFFPESMFAEWMRELDLLKNRLASMEGALA